MDIGLGMNVYTSDGQGVGSIDRLILDPDTNQVKAAVIRKGVLLPHDKEVIREIMNITSDGAIRLSATAAEVHSLPEFLPGAYTTPPADYPLPAGYPSESVYLTSGFGLGGLGATPVGMMPDNAEAREVRAAWHRQDLENAVIQEGSKVFSREGEQIGEVHQLNFNQQTGALTHLVVRRGFIFTTDTELPASMIARVDDGAVTLSVSAAEAKGAMAAIEAGEDPDGVPAR
jgi:sporulation protein YlmC with PRC-barrel domain